MLNTIVHQKLLYHTLNINSTLIWPALWFVDFSCSADRLAQQEVNQFRKQQIFVSSVLYCADERYN